MRKLRTLLLCLSLSIFLLTGCGDTRVKTSLVDQPAAQETSAVIETAEETTEVETTPEESTEEPTTPAPTESSTEAITVAPTEPPTEATTVAPTTAAPTVAPVKEATTEAPRETTAAAPTTTAAVEEEALTPSGIDYIGNMNTKKFHYSTCKSVKQMSEKNKFPYTGTRDEMIAKGYVPCKNCNP